MLYKAAIVGALALTANALVQNATMTTRVPGGIVGSSSTTTQAPSVAGSQIQVLGVQGYSVTAGAAVSIISADACDTTFVIQCTAAACEAYGSIGVTFTQNPTEQIFTYSTSIYGIHALYSGSCSIGGTTTAVCTEVISGSADGQSTSTAITASLSSLEYHPLPVTAGGSLLAAATGSCTVSPGAAAPTAVAKSIVYKVLVPMGVAAGAVAMI